jgi:hypothetical protein
MYVHKNTLVSRYKNPKGSWAGPTNGKHHVAHSSMCVLRLLKSEINKVLAATLGAKRTAVKWNPKRLR